MRTLTDEEKAIAESFFDIPNKGPSLSERRDVFDACAFLLKGNAKNPIEYQKKACAKFTGTVFDSYYCASYETMKSRTCDADWFQKVDKIVSEKNGHLTIDEIHEKTKENYQKREKYLNSLDDEESQKPSL